MSEVQTIPVKQISQKTAGIDPSSTRDDKEKSLPMLRVYGVIQSVKIFEDRKGKLQTTFIGDFRAVSPDGTKKYVADKMYMFKHLEDKLVAEHKSGGDKPLEFGYDISARYNDKSVTKYEYVATSIIKLATSDAMLALESQIAANTKQPEAPVEETKTESAKKGK